MKKFKIKMERTQRGEKLDWEKEIIVECEYPPKIGEGKILAIHPPIYQTIVSVEEVPETNN